MASRNASRGARLRELDRTIPVPAAFPAISLEFNQAEFAKLADKFRKFPGAIKEASFQAAEKTRIKTRAEFVRDFTRLVTLTAAYVKKGVKSSKTRWKARGALAEIRIATGNVPLSRYAVKPETPPQLKGVAIKNRLRVSYRLRKSGRSHGDIPRSEQAPAGAKLFVQKMSSGHVGAFFKTGKRKFMEDYGPSLQYHAHAEGFLPQIENFSRTVFRTAFLSEAEKMTGLKS